MWSHARTAVLISPFWNLARCPAARACNNLRTEDKNWEQEQEGESLLLMLLLQFLQLNPRLCALTHT